MRIISFNINSIRARPHQLIHLRDTLDPDVIGLQETKVNDPDFPLDVIEEIGYHPEYWGQKGHYGVASHHYDVPPTAEGMRDFTSLLRVHSAKGECLLKGPLKQQLTDESRAGKSDRNAYVEYLVLDLDSMNVPGFTNKKQLTADDVQRTADTVIAGSNHNKWLPH